MNLGGTFIPRKVYEPGGIAYLFTGGKSKPLPPHVAGLIHHYGGGKRFSEITWEEVMAERRKRQAERLERIRQVDRPTVLPCFVWTFFNKQDIPYHGWYCYVVTRHFDVAVNFRGFLSELAESIMREIPLVTPLRENFETWMQLFAKTYPRTHRKDRRKAGTLTGWLTDRRRFSLSHPETNSPAVHSTALTPFQEHLL